MSNQKLETPLNGQILRSDEDIKKIAKRITMLMRELEAQSMDMVLYSKPLAAGKFPATHLAQVSNALTSAITELTRVNKAWQDLFKEELSVSK